MAALIDAIDIKRKAYFELENTPFYCLEPTVSTPTARGGQTLVRLKMRNLLTSAVFDKTFKAKTSSRSPTCRSSPPPTSTATATAPTSSIRRPTRPSP
jgi:elongation factor P